MRPVDRKEVLAVVGSVLIYRTQADRDRTLDWFKQALAAIDERDRLICEVLAHDDRQVEYYPTTLDCELLKKLRALMPPCPACDGRGEDGTYLTCKTCKGARVVPGGTA